MCVQRTRETSGNGEGIEIVTNEPYQTEEESGQYTHKIFHFKSKVPGAIRWAVPDKYLHVHEKSHNGYPHFHTFYEQPGMGDSFYLLVESQHVAYDPQVGCPDNLLNLTSEELKARKIVYLDIVNGKPAPSNPEWDMHNFVCPEAQVNEPLQTPENICDPENPPEWTRHYHGEMMVCVKVIKFKFKFFGIQTIVQNFVMNKVFPEVFLDSHRAIMFWAKEWFPLTLQDIRRMEEELQQEQAAQQFEQD